jgi:GWxTD domain-containing protein
VVEILSYVASDPEYDELRAARTDSTRQVAWDAFWARRDPTPDTPRNEAMTEFFRRVRFANRNFAGQAVTGWRSDQGRVYIRHGAPDQVDDRPATFYDPPLQIWHYQRLNRRYVFADREGFGRFELIYPSGER